MSGFLGFLAGASLFAAIACLAGAIWTSGDLSSRLGATGGLGLCVAFVLGMGAFLSSDAI